jgi:hypothetical protein
MDPKRAMSLSRLLEEKEPGTKQKVLRVQTPFKDPEFTIDLDRLT